MDIRDGAKHCLGKRPDPANRSWDSQPGWPPRTVAGHIDVDAILALLPDEDPGDNPWGSTNLAYFDEAGNLIQPT